MSPLWMGMVIMQGGSDRIVKAAATLSLSGPLALQGREAARGLESWAADDHVDLRLVDDSSSPETARRTYEEWLAQGEVDILLGPYGSNLVRRVAPLVSGREILLWNHGGSADDLARPLVVPVAAPASTYFRGVVELAHRQGLARVMLIRGSGRFAKAVAEGAASRATELDLQVTETPFSDWRSTATDPRSAVLIVGTFEEDLAMIEQVREAASPGLLGCVAAGLPQFGERLGAAAEGVLGPVQWVPDAATPRVGPTGIDFSRRYESDYGKAPGYVAAQAAAAGYLAALSCRPGDQPQDVRAWRTTTFLGPFALDRSWRQVGHSPSTVQWRGGRQRPLAW